MPPPMASCHRARRAFTVSVWPSSMITLFSSAATPSVRSSTIQQRFPNASHQTSSARSTAPTSTIVFFRYSSRGSS